MHNLLKLAQLIWTGHITSMPDERLPKEVFYGDLQVGKRSLDVQKKPYKDSLKDFNIPPESWEKLHWIEQSGVASLEREQMTMKQRESAKQKESMKSTKPEPRDHRCHHSQN